MEYSAPILDCLKDEHTLVTFSFSAKACPKIVINHEVLKMPKSPSEFC